MSSNETRTLWDQLLMVLVTITQIEAMIITETIENDLQEHLTEIERKHDVTTIAAIVSHDLRQLLDQL
jgi:hypothetical protein